ncbi:AraC family transcriptional regulator [Chryseobacterium lactis]|uniref:AraC family transcriptional regulator n=1 Tax=Chryseobacterium lactis TaxID=1241981 RepID=UPI000F512C3A|nr:helix-turn-helix domain-containing protein [Chryseobacterium lactis]AZB04871.1 AraC family transcriptional regulator [Chryseobacterium lactis]
MNEKKNPVQKFKEIQGRLKIYHDIFFYEPKGLCPLYTPVSHDFFSLLLFKETKGKHSIDGKEYPVEGMQLHMVFPGQVRWWDYERHGEIYKLFVSGEVFERLEGLMQLPVFMYKEKPVINLNEEIFEKLLHEFKDIRDELNNPSPVMNEIIYSKMKIIARYISNEVQKNAEYLNIYEDHPVLFDFMTLLNQNFRQERSKKYYADQLRINANYLNILCKKYLGHTATEVIQSQTLEKIKYKLMMTKDPLKDIAFDFNFQNYGHFSGFIKNIQD